MDYAEYTADRLLWEGSGNDWYADGQMRLTETPPLNQRQLQ